MDPRTDEAPAEDIPLEAMPTEDLNDEDATDEEIAVHSHRRSSRQSLSGTKHLLFDQKYHPIDDYINPSNAAKRRHIHELPDETCADISDSESESNQGSDPTQDFVPSRSKQNKMQPRRRSSGSRHSNRASALRPINYSSLYHPLDDILIASGAVRRLPSGKISENLRAASDADSDSGSDSIECVEKDLEELAQRDIDDLEHNSSQEDPSQDENSALPAEGEIHLEGHEFMHEIEANDLPQSPLSEYSKEDMTIHQVASNAPLGYGPINIALSDQHDDIDTADIIHAASSPTVYERWRIVRSSAPAGKEGNSRPTSAGSAFPTDFDQALELTELQHAQSIPPY